MPAFSRSRWTPDTTALGTVSLTLRRRVSSAATPSMASKTTSGAMRALLRAAVEHAEHLDVLGRECPQHFGLILRDEQRGREREQQQPGRGDGDTVAVKDRFARVAVCGEHEPIAMGPGPGPTRMVDSGPSMGAPAIGMKTRQEQPRGRQARGHEPGST